MGKKKKKKTSLKIGLSPGSFIHIGEKKVEQILIDLIDYDLQKYEFKRLKSIEEAFQYKDTHTVSWLNIVGLHDTEIMQKIGRHFGIHPLVIEDILNTEQRPKIEIYDNYIFISLKMLTYDTVLKEVQDEQMSLILGKHFVISFQEREGDVLAPVRERIKSGAGRIRKLGPDYLMYAIMDIIIDHYFYVLDCMDDEINQLEDKVMNTPDQEHLQRIHYLKRELVNFRRSVWPMREVVSSLTRDEYHLVKETTEPFLRDLYDHVFNISELIESLRDMVTGLMDVYLSNISNRMNEVMKVLTIIATIFIPLSFLAGIYGMNFEFMPELKWRYSYYILWGFIIIVAGGMMYYFRRKKWL
jgi:magnesium transporter